MFGMRDEFTYVECSNCGVVQIASVPADLARYYPRNYYSYSAHDRKQSPFKLWRRKMLYSQRFGRETLLGAAVTLVSNKLPSWMDKRYLGWNSRILDVGCGSGSLLLDMQRGGFTQLAGVDPFIEADIDYKCGVRVAKRDFAEIRGPFDFIMFHSSFEHMDGSLEIFKHLREILADDGYALIRIPVADSFAYREYRADWVNLDPPRHLYIHTTKSIQLLASQSGLELTQVIHDSTAQQFCGSELYRRNLTLDSYIRKEHRNLFSHSQKRKYKRLARELNQRGEGDQACFFLRKTSSA